MLLPQGLSLISGLLGKLKIDPSAITKGLAGDATEAQLARTKAAAVARLVGDGMTPAEFCDDDAEKRQLIRSALFSVLKPIVKNGHAADVIRDLYDDGVVALLLPRVQKTWTVEQLVEATVHALRERIF